MQTRLKFFMTFLTSSMLFFSSCKKETIEEPKEQLKEQNKEQPEPEEKELDEREIQFNKLTRVNVVIEGEESVGDALIRVIEINGSDKAYVLPVGDYLVSKAILLPKVNNIAIIGSLDDNKKTIVRTNATEMRTSNFASRSGVFICQGNNIDFRNFTIDGGHSFATDKESPRLNYACVNTYGGEDMNAENMRFLNATFGFCSPANGTWGFQASGLPIHGIRVVNSDFMNIGRGVMFNRGWSRKRYDVQVGNVRSMKKIYIAGNTFSGTMYAGITIDAGNDGSDGASFLRDKPGSDIAKGVVVDFNNSVIENNTFNAAQRYNLAFAKVSHFIVRNNTFKGNTTVNFDGTTNTFARSLNIEHESNNIEVLNNTFDAPVRTDAEIKKLQNRHIFAVTFTDYGNSGLPENGVSDIKIVNNTFKGSVEVVILGSETTNFTIDRNHFKTKGVSFDIHLRRAFNKDPKFRRGNINEKITNNTPVGSIFARIEKPNNINKEVTF